MNAERLLAHYERIADAPDAVSRLRRFILDLAVRGKLVPQNPKDEPVKELLKRIAVEKARLVRAGDLRKPRDLDGGGALEEPFAIPTEWRWVRLDVVGAIIGGGTPSATDAENFSEPGEGVPWLTPADLGGYSGLYISRGARDLSEKGSHNTTATLMPTGTVLFTSRAPIGYVAIAANPISTNQGFKSIVPYVADCSRFIATVMKAFAPEIDAKAPGTTFKEVSGKIVAAIPFPLPPLAEQHRIVAKVDELMALCDRLEAARVEREATRDRLAAASVARLNAPDSNTFHDDARFVLDTLQSLTARPDQIKELRQTILNLAIYGRLVRQDRNDEPASELLERIKKEKRESPPRRQHRHISDEAQRSVEEFPLPLNWSWTNLGTISLDMRYGTAKKCAYEQIGAPVLRIPNVSGGRLNLEDLKYGPLTKNEIEELNLRRGDLLVIRSNGSLEIVGRAAEIDQSADGMSFAGYLVRVRLSTENIVTRFIWLAMNTDYVRDQIEKPIRSAVGLKNVNSTELSALNMPLPPLAEQHRIVAKVDELMALCDRLKTSLITSEETRGRLLDALLAEALASGEGIVPKEPEKVTAHG